MKNQENSEYIVPSETVIDLKRIQKRLMELVDGDEDFAANIIESCLKIGTEFYIDDINDIVWKKYPGIHTDSKLIAEGKHELFTLIYDLTGIIVGLHKATIKGYDSNARDKTEQEVIRIFYPGGEEIEEIHKSDIIGDIIEQF